MYAWPSRCVALAKHSLQYMWPFGPAAVLCGTVFVDRSNRKQAIRTMSNVAQIIKKEKVGNSHGWCAIAALAVFEVAMHLIHPNSVCLFSGARWDGHQCLNLGASLKCEGGQICLSCVKPYKVREIQLKEKGGFVGEKLFHREHSSTVLFHVKLPRN